jgi:hypothetical protein
MQSYRIIIVISILLTITIIALYLHFFVINKSNDSEKPLALVQQESKPPPSDQLPAEKAEKDLQLFPDLPPLSESDTYIRDALKNASSILEFQNWLKEKDIIRRFVAVVDNIVNGENPAANLNFLKPEKNFQIITHKQNLILDPNNYIRYDRTASIFDSLKIKTLLNLFYHIEPLLDETYQKMGYPGQYFRPALMRAIDIILDIPIIKVPIFLQKKVITYSFENQEFENLSPAQKLILRLGPENIRKIQKKCRDFGALIRPHTDQ